MKKQFAIFAAVVFASGTLVQAQEADSQGASVLPASQEPVESTEVIIIEEPSGAQPEAPVPAPPPTPPGFEQAPVDPAAEAPGKDEQTNAVTVTVSQSFTNAQNAITIVGAVNTEEEKQKVEQALQQALPGKEINNHLIVSGQQITEPAGAETPQEEPAQGEPEQEDDPKEDEAGVDAEREFDLQQQGDSQSQP